MPHAGGACSVSCGRQSLLEGSKSSASAAARDTGSMLLYSGHMSRLEAGDFRHNRNELSFTVCGGAGSSAVL